VESDAQSDLQQDQVTRRAERFGRGWLVAICLALLVLTAGVGAGGYLALKSHDQSEAIAREDAMALQRAKECVEATQAPDIAAMTASQTKVIECATGDFGVQANLFASMLVEAYQAANVSVQVSDMRGAVEKHNDDGSVDVLVAVRVKVTNSQAADQEQGYRLRVNMAPADGTYKINRLDQVTS
jgi:Mce-associated membrane protein